MMKWLWQFVTINPLFSIVLLVSFFLRLYNLESTQPFFIDEARDMLMIRGIGEEKFPLLGPVTSIGKIHLGPLYYYLMFPIAWLFQFHPLSLTYTTAVLGCATVFLLYHWGKDLVGELAATWAALFYSLSFVVLNFSRIAWNPNTVPFFALLFYWLLFKLKTTQKLRFILGSFICYACLLQLHYSALFLFPLFAYHLYQHKRRTDVRKFFKNMALSLTAFTILFLPFLYKQIHNYSRISGQLQSLLFSSQQISWNGVSIGLNFWEKLSHISLIFGLPAWQWFGLGFMCLLSWQWFSHKDISRTLFAILLLGLLGTSLLMTPVSLHYYAIIFPAVFLLAGQVFSQLKYSLLKNKLVMTVLLFGYAYLQWPSYNINQPLNWRIRDYELVANDIAKDAQRTNYNIFGIDKFGQHINLSYRYYLEPYKTNLQPILDFQNLDRLYVVADKPLVLTEDNQVIISGSSQQQLPSHVTKQWQYHDGYMLYRLE